MRNPFIETSYAVAYRKIENENDLIFRSSEKKAFSLIKTGWRYWCADPIVFSYNGKDWLFVEKFDKLKRKGVLSVCEIKDGRFGEFVDVLEEPYHLSYPLVFEKGGKVYMLPELTSNKSVDLYVATDFPYHWKKQVTLFQNVLYADTNVVEVSGKWYLITGQMDPAIGSRTRTLLFDAENIESGELNLLSEAKEFSFDDRGAGNIFVQNGALIRPSQGGDEENYGTFLKFSEVTFENNQMVSSPICRVGIDRLLLTDKRTLCGTHTYAKKGDIEIVDVKLTERSRIPVVIVKTFHKIKRIFKRV